MSLPVRKRNRLRGYDYSLDGRYFFTSNVKYFRRYFGEIIGQRMRLNVFGEIVLEQWIWLGARFPYAVQHAFVIMPDHVHGIIEIKSSFYVEKPSSESGLPKGRNKIKPLDELVGAFKMTSSKRIRLLESELNPGHPPQFHWHRSFHDHIIRSDKAFGRIVKYIVENPKHWRG
jgi:putative transposase